MSQLDRHRHVFGRFIRSEAKHDALVAGPKLIVVIIRSAAAFESIVDTPGDVRTLLLHFDLNTAGLGGETQRFFVVADVRDDPSHKGFEVGRTRGADLTGDDDETAGDENFTSDSPGGILSQYRVEDGI
jgi:hypothetical protein